MVLGSLDEDFLHSVLEKSPVVGRCKVTVCCQPYEQERLM